MKRRTFILGTGAAAAGGSALLGSGAFSSVEAERDVTVEVADDADGYLGLEPSDGPNSEYATVDGDGQLALTIEDTEAGGAGANPNAETLMDDVFVVTNQGTQEVEFIIEGSGMGGWFTSNFGVYVVEDGDRISVMTADVNFENVFDAEIQRSGGDGQVLGPGDSIEVGVAINGTAPTSKDRDDLTLTAEATSEE